MISPIILDQNRHPVSEERSFADDGAEQNGDSAGPSAVLSSVRHGILCDLAANLPFA